MVYFSLVPRPHLGTRLGVSMPSGLSTHYPGSVFHIYLGRARIGDLSHIDYLAFCCQSMHVHAFAILLGSWLQLAWKLYPFRFSLWKVNVQTALSGMRWLYNPFSSYPCDVHAVYRIHDILQNFLCGIYEIHRVWAFYVYGFCAKTNWIYHLIGMTLKVAIAIVRGMFFLTN